MPRKPTPRAAAGAFKGAPGRAEPPGELRLRVSMLPAGAAPRARGDRPAPRWPAWAPHALGLLSAALLLLGTVGWPGVAHAMAAMHLHQAQAAFQTGLAGSDAGRRHLFAALGWQPDYQPARLKLMRSELGAFAYAAAIAQADALLRTRHRPPEASLAHSYAGYAHGMLGHRAQAEVELELACQLDPANALARRLLGGLQLTGELPALLPAESQATARAE